MKNVSRFLTEAFGWTLGSFEETPDVHSLEDICHDADVVDLEACLVHMKNDFISIATGILQILIPKGLDCEELRLHSMKVACWSAKPAIWI